MADFPPENPTSTGAIPPLPLFDLSDGFVLGLCRFLGDFFGQAEGSQSCGLFAHSPTLRLIISHRLSAFHDLLGLLEIGFGVVTLLRIFGQKLSFHRAEFRKWIKLVVYD
jgi:hypothetical protein